MEALNLQMAKELSRYAEVQIVAPTEASVAELDQDQVHHVLFQPLSLFFIQATWKAIRIALSWKPNVILAGSGLSAPMVYIAARLSGAKAMIYVHGLDVEVKHPLYRLLWLPTIRWSDRIVANSQNTMRLAIERGVQKQKIGIVHPGTDLALSERSLDSGYDFRTEHNLGTGPILLSVGRLTERKGIREFVQRVLPRLVDVFTDLKLVIIGDVPKNALYAKGQSVESIQKVAQVLGLQDNIIFLGEIRNRQTLSAAYQAATVHVFPVRDIAGDHEGFGMVAIEAAAQGLATVAYETGGVTDAIAVGISGLLVEPGDDIAFFEAVVKIIDNPLLVEPMKEFAAGFGWERFGQAMMGEIDKW